MFGRFRYGVDYAEISDYRNLHLTNEFIQDYWKDTFEHKL